MTDPISLQPRTEDAISLTVTQAGKRLRLPPDLLDDVSKRLQFLCVLLGVVVVAGSIVSELTDFIDDPVVYYTTDAVTLLCCIVMFFIARSGKVSATRLLDIGLVFQVVIALAIAISFVPATWFEDTRPGFAWSPIAVWVIIYPIIVPNTTKHTFVASILAAATEPLTLLVMSRTGFGELPAANVILRQLWPNVVAIGFAVMISRVVYGLGEKLSRARQMGSYQLVELLGHGGMGEVWKATHRMLARDSAVKLIHPEVLGEVNEDGVRIMLQRFEREAQATAALRSPHTIELYDFGIARDGTFYYVMELLDGLDLQSLVYDYGPQPPERVVMLLRQVCHSLHEAHRGGLVHRDIKPANIFVCRYGTDLDFVKVLDFGIVKRVEIEGKADAQLTQLGAISGTPAYMAPEMAVGGQEIDGRADIYALGCVAYWLLTAQTVFEKPSALAMIMSHANQQPIPISDRTQQAVPEQLEQIVMQCLAKKPEERPQTTLELSNMLAGLKLEAQWTAERAGQWWYEHEAKSRN
jgi:serine/threonine-protein kinase